MKSKLLLSVCLLLVSIALHAQQKVPKCGSAIYVKELDQKYPGLEKALKTMRFPENKNNTRAAIVYIPVVVHVVSKNGQEDIPEVYIQAQIDQLNRCYGRTNTDTTNMRSIYQSRVGATKIRFWLDQIRRVTTTIPNFDANNFGMPDHVKETANGGDDAISPSTKLNLWICDLTINGVDGLVGYAYPPAGLPNWGGGGNAPIPGYDGVVLDFQDVGGPNKHPYGYASWGFRGKTLVHEVGHYLGLRHIWGDDGGACHGQANFEDDGIADTPEAGSESQDNCNNIASNNSCIETTGDLPDMVEDYMDYSSGDCQNSFTKGQVTFMENVIDNIRSTVRIPTAINEFDIASSVSVYPNPANEEFSIRLNNLNFETIEISIKNSVGQVVKKITSHESKEQYTISIQDLAKGMYFVTLQLDNKTKVTKNIIFN